MSKTVKIVRKTAAAPSKSGKVPAKPRTPILKVNGERLPLDVPVNVKIAGERVMRKNVILVLDPVNAGHVLVRTGRRGRPLILPVENIVKVRAL